MHVRTISARNMGAMIALMTLTALLMTGFGAVVQDMWIAVIIAAAMSVPLALLHSRTARLFPGKGIYDIAELVLGKWLCRVLTMLIALYSLHIASIVAFNFAEFIATISLPLTPGIIVTMCIIATAGYLASGGFYNLGKWSIAVLVICIINFLFTIFCSFGSLDFTNLLPIMEHHPTEIFSAAFSLFSSSFGEIIVLMAAFSSLRKKSSPYKACFSGLAIGFIVLFLAAVRNAAVLGHGMMSLAAFPSYITARIIQPGSFIEQIESVLSFSLVLIGITKIAVCLRAASIGFAKLTGVENKERLMIIPCCLISTAMCVTGISNLQELVRYMDIYRYYSLAFILLIPLIIWIMAERKARFLKKIVSI